VPVSSFLPPFLRLITFCPFGKSVAIHTLSMRNFKLFTLCLYSELLNSLVFAITMTMSYKSTTF
jgi:hypothetical protein